MAMRHDPQQHFEEQGIHNEDLLIAIETALHTKEAVRRNRKAKKEIKKHMTGLPQGRYRCGPYILEVNPMDGGDFHVDPWSTMVIRITAE